jgi:hypothetical protein
VSADSVQVIEQKFAKYGTTVHHEPNTTLIKVLKDYISRGLFVIQPTAAQRTPNAVTRKFYSVSFNKAFSQRPVVLAGIDSFNSAETAGVRIKQLNRKGFEVKTEDDNPSTNNPVETVSYFAAPPGLIQNITGNTVGEAGRVTAYQKNGSQWHTVKLSHTFTEPVVLMQIDTFHGRQPAHIRVKNVGADSFQFQIEEWDYLDQKHLLEDIGYIVFERGNHQLTDGRRIEAGKIQSNHSWTAVSLTSGFATAPVVVSLCQTANDTPAVITRHNSIASGGFNLKLQEEGGADGIHATETAGYLAAEPD